MPKILVVEDDAGLNRMIREWLTFERNDVDYAENGTDGLEKLQSYEYDCIVMDWELPGISGIEIVQKFRAMGRPTPVLMLTGKSTINDKEQGFDAGADDYLTKPFHMKELSARIRALMRRASVNVSTVVEVRGIRLDTASFRVNRGNEDIQLLPKEFALLEFLMRHADQVFSAESLLSRVWSSDSDATIDAITTCIKRIRKKLDRKDEPSVIKTVHGVGYKFDPKA